MAAWTIPDLILGAAPEPPYRLDPAAFRRPDHAADTPSRRMALAALPAGGSVLDVGAGAGAASLALVPPAGRITAVDTAADMLAAFAAAAEDAGVAHEEVQGRWPDVADAVCSADVVVCHHVAYNVADLGAFASALAMHARSRVVLELTTVHPWQPMNPLWKALHDLDRPDGPTADDARSVLAEVGIAALEVRWRRSGRQPEVTPETVAHARRRLCLPAARDQEIADLLEGVPLRPDTIATLWWDGPGLRAARGA